MGKPKRSRVFALGDAFMQDVQFVTASIGNTGRPAIPSGVEGHFLLHFYAVVARILTRLEITGAGEQNGMYAERFPFLATYRNILHALVPGEITQSTQAAWWDA